MTAVNLWFFENQSISGIFNVGTGKSRSFNSVARTIIDWHGYGEIKYIDFPEHLKGSYQSYTEADIHALRKTGYLNDFLPLEAGIKRYLDCLNSDM